MQCVFRITAALCVFLVTQYNVTASESVRTEDASATVQRTPERVPDVVYVPTPQDVVERMLKVAKVTKDDLVYDLGCGDGRIVVTAAKKIGCRGVGFDIDPERIRDSLANVKKNDVEALVSIREKDIFQEDVSKASVVTLYLLPELNVRLIPQLETLKPGSRVVSHDFSMRGVQPDKVVKIKSKEDGRVHRIYLWTTPLKKVKAKQSARKKV